MTLNLSVSEKEELKPRITVFGVGGAGGNAVNNMIEKQLKGVDFVVANTDAQALQQSQSSHKIQLGVKVTEGLGAGAEATRPHQARRVRRNRVAGSLPSFQAGCSSCTLCLEVQSQAERLACFCHGSSTRGSKKG